MSDYRLQDHQQYFVNRRSFLSAVGGGFGGMALSALMADDAQRSSPFAARSDCPHFPARAKQVIQIFVSGAMSQIDTFDYKPELETYDGQAFEPGGKVELFESIPGAIRPSYWPFQQHGECG